MRYLPLVIGFFFLPALASEEYIYEFCKCSLPSSGIGHPYFYTLCLNDPKGPLSCREARCQHQGFCVTDEKFILDAGGEEFSF